MTGKDPSGGYLFAMSKVQSPRRTYPSGFDSATPMCPQRLEAL